MQCRKYRMVFVFLLLFIALLIGCSRVIADNSSSRSETGSETVEERRTEVKDSDTEAIAQNEVSTVTAEDNKKMVYTLNTKVWDVIDNPAFKGYGRLIFPADKTIDKSMTLSEVGNILTWYNYVNTERTVKIVNYMKTKAEAGKQFFYDIYTDEEKAADPAKKNTGLFFF